MISASLFGRDFPSDNPPARHPTFTPTRFHNDPCLPQLVYARRNRINARVKVRGNLAIAAAALAVVCGLLATVLVFYSPVPMPAGHAQLLAALIALFSAAGYSLIRTTRVGTRKSK